MATEDPHVHSIFEEAGTAKELAGSAFVILVLSLLQSDMARSLLQSRTIPRAVLQDEATAVSAAILLLFLFCVGALLQSGLIRAAGHSLQHRASMLKPRRSRSMTSTSAAELYYLRHNRSCAAAATGNKGHHPGQSRCPPNLWR